MSRAETAELIDLPRPKETQVQSYSPGGTNVPDEHFAMSCAKMATLVQPGKYD